MQVKWILDGDLFEEYRQELIREIQSQGHIPCVVHAPNPPYRWDQIPQIKNLLNGDCCTIAHADIALSTRFCREERICPGAFCNVEHFYCSSYLCWLGKYWLNKDYAMIPFGELPRLKDNLFDTFGIEGKIFVRPDSPIKIFNGQTIQHQTFDKDYDYLGFYDFPEKEIVVVSSPKEIAAEWRFVIANGVVVTGSQYMLNGNLHVQKGFPDNAFELADEIAKINQPDPVWILDICQTFDKQFHMIEIGGFSFANLYACDLNAVVRVVSAAAQTAYHARKNCVQD